MAETVDVVDKAAESDDQPPPEPVEQLEQQRDPDEAVLAEQAILSYAAEVLQQFQAEIETATDNIAAWVDSHQELETGNVGPQLGQAFLEQMVAACGGMDAPVGAALYDQLDGEVDSLVRDEADAGLLVTNLGRAARDFGWYLRDNLQSVLSHQWDQLRDLAYGGSTDYIAALHAYGVPRFDWSGISLQSGLIAVGETTLAQQPKTQEEVISRDPEQEQREQAQALQEATEKNPATV